MARFTDDCDPTSWPSARAIAQIFRCPHASHDSAYLATVGSIRTLHRRRPRPLLKVAGPPPGQPVVIGAARHPDQLSEPRDRELGFDTDHLEVTEGGRYSAPFRHTRNWTWASPRAAFNSSFSTSSSNSRELRRRAPFSSPSRPASKNCFFQL